MEKLKAKEWLQLVLMAPLAIWVIVLLGRWGTGTLDNMGVSEASSCYSYLYTYSGQDGYFAAICDVPREGVAIIRAQTESLALIATNHPVDLAAIALVFLASLLAWLLFLKRVLSTYVPGI